MKNFKFLAIAMLFAGVGISTFIEARTTTTTSSTATYASPRGGCKQFDSKKSCNNHKACQWKHMKCRAKGAQRQTSSTWRAEHYHSTESDNE